VSDFLQRIQNKLDSAEISVGDVRDGIIESYVVSNRQALQEGLTNIAIDASDEEVFEKISEMMRGLFKERGADFDAPTPRDLRSIRHTMDLKLRFNELPMNISETHEVICEMLLEKISAPILDELSPPSMPSGFSELTKLPDSPPSNPPPGPPPTPPPTSPSASFPVASSSTFSPEHESRITESQAASSKAFASPTDKSEEDTWSPFAASLEARLKMDFLSPQDARDGIIESFVRASAAADANISEGEVEMHIRQMMREFFANKHISFDEPDIKALQEAKNYLDERLNITAFDASIKLEHDKTCEELISKAKILLNQILPESETAAIFEPVTPPATPPVTSPATPSEAPTSTPPLTPAQSPVMASEQSSVPSSEPAESQAAVPVSQSAQSDNDTDVPPIVPLTDSTSPSSINAIMADLDPAIKEMIKAEIKAALDDGKKQALILPPPSGLNAMVLEDALFLTWMDIPQQPAYHVYVKRESGWVKLTPIPLARSSFYMKAVSKGELTLAVSSVSHQGLESELSEEIKITV